MMSYSKRSRYSCSPPPYNQYSRSASRLVSRSRSRSRSFSRSRSRSRDSSVENPGNNLYVTGLSTRVTKRDLEKHFSTEGKVEDVHLVVDPWSRESRGFGFVTMSTVEEANRCIKYLNRSIMEGRVIMVEKARRRRGRTPTPGRYLGLRTVHGRRRSPSCSSYSRSSSPRYSSERERSRSYSPYSRRRRSYSPYYGHHDSYSPRYSRGRSYSRSRSPYSRSPVSRRDRSYSPYDSSYYLPDDQYHRNRHYRSVSRSMSPMRSFSRSVSPRPRRSWRRSYSRSVSPRPRRSWRRNNSRSVSPRRSRRRDYSISPVKWRRDSRSVSPMPIKSSPRRRGRDYSPDRYSSWRRSYSYSRRHSGSPCSRSVSRSVTPRSTLPSS